MRVRPVVTMALAASLTLALPVLAFGAPAEGHGGGAKGGDDLFEFNRFLDLGLWTLVVFLGLLFVLSRTAWPMMLEGLRKREGGIRQAMEDARQAKAAAEGLKAKFEAEVAKAQEQARVTIEEARRDAQRAGDEMIAKAKAEIGAERDRLRREIETARDQALQDIWAQGAQLATLISSKALKRQVSIEDHRRLVDEAIAELPAAAAAVVRAQAS